MKVGRLELAGLELRAVGRLPHRLAQLVSRLLSQRREYVSLELVPRSKARALVEV